jgi:hypothetical protein
MHTITTHKQTVPESPAGIPQQNHRAPVTPILRAMPDQAFPLTSFTFAY